MKESTYCEIDDLEYELKWKMWDEFQKNPDKLQKWDVISRARVLKVWRDSARMGFVRDEKGLNEMSELVIRNVLRLRINTIMCGHSSIEPSVYLDEENPLSEEVIEKWTDTMENDKGEWLLSDYGLEPLEELVAELYEESDSDKKLVLLDRIFNVAHCRSDLAELFIEGGSETLDELACG